MSAIARIGVIGGGAWGTALALSARRAGRDVVLYARDAEAVAAINAGRGNPAHLPGIPLDPPIRATTDMSEAAGCDAVLLVTPAQTTAAVVPEVARRARPGTPLVLCAKGIERATGRLLSDVLAEAAPGFPRAALSGPGFATDVARGLPTAVTIAADDPALADRLAAALAGPTFRPYASSDLTGVEIGGSLKNVLAIACGIVAGRGLGASAQSALIARAFAELTRLGLALGARAETLTGLSGLGDLVLTATNLQSRNFAFGIALGKGEVSIGAPTSGPLVEGAATAPVAVAMGERHGVELPVCKAVADVLSGRITIDGAIEALLSRPLKREDAI